MKRATLVKAIYAGLMEEGDKAPSIEHDKGYAPWCNLVAQNIAARICEDRQEFEPPPMSDCTTVANGFDLMSREQQGEAFFSNCVDAFRDIHRRGPDDGRDLSLTFSLSFVPIREQAGVKLTVHTSAGYGTNAIDVEAGSILDILPEYERRLHYINRVQAKQLGASQC